MSHDATERAWAEQRADCWRRFLAAVDAGLASNWAGCAAIVGHSNAAATELRNVIKAVREGRLVRTADGLRVIRPAAVAAQREPNLAHGDD